MDDWKDKVECDFAVIDIKKHRRRVAAALKRGEAIEFVITGTLQASKSAIGNDDGVSIEFCADIHGSQFTEPKR